MYSICMIVNPRIYVGAVVGAFVVIIAIVGFSGSTIIDDVSGGNSFLSRPSADAPRVLPVEIELEELSILEVNERAATLEIKFKVTNPNFKAVILQLVKYNIYEDGVRIHAGQIGERPDGMVTSSNYFTILSETPTILSDKITIKNTGNTPELWESLQNDNLIAQISGEAFFNLSSMTSGGENIIAFEFTN